MAFCYTCYDERETRPEEREHSIVVRGEHVAVKTAVPICPVCGDEVLTPEAENAILVSAYEEYRRRHGLLSPRAIASIRQRYGLSQRGVARLFGWGPITVQRYERGALQDNTHNLLISKMNDPSFVLEALDSPSCKLTNAEREMLRSKVLDSTAYYKEQAASAVEGVLTREAPSEYTGFRRPSLERLGQMALIFASGLAGHLFKVKLMKLWFYADFLHFQREGVSISGFPYARLNMGPVPDNFSYILGWMESTGMACIDVVPTTRGEGEVLVPLVTPQENLFSDSEKEDMSLVLAKLGSKTGAVLASISHREPAWQNTPHAARISYLWAKDLKAFPAPPTGDAE